MGRCARNEPVFAKRPYPSQSLARISSAGAFRCSRDLTASELPGHKILRPRVLATRKAAREAKQNVYGSELSNVRVTNRGPGGTRLSRFELAEGLRVAVFRSQIAARLP